MVQQFNRTISEALNEASLFLESQGHNGQDVKYYWMLVHKWDLTKLVKNLSTEISIEDDLYFKEVIHRISKDEPIQYILGRAEFMSENFIVNQNTLIPRPETEGLVKLVEKFIEKSSADQRILDIGTGSGVIAIMLAKRNPQAIVYASDISQQALDVASLNAKRHQVEITFINSDLLSMMNGLKFDVIVSNPPYIGIDEQEVMDASVLKYEPKQALFASHYGLAIYQQLAQNIETYMNPNGLICFEIGYRQGKRVQNIFKQKFPSAIINLYQDLHQHDRYIEIQLRG